MHRLHDYEIVLGLEREVLGCKTRKLKLYLELVIAGGNLKKILCKKIDSIQSLHAVPKNQQPFLSRCLDVEET